MSDERFRVDEIAQFRSAQHRAELVDEQITERLGLDRDTVDDHSSGALEPLGRIGDKVYVDCRRVIGDSKTNEARTLLDC